MTYYDASKVHDQTSMYQHLVATKKIRDIDMQSKPLDWKKLAEDYFRKAGDSNG